MADFPIYTKISTCAKCGVTANHGVMWISKSYSFNCSHVSYSGRFEHMHVSCSACRHVWVMLPMDSAVTYAEWDAPAGYEATTVINAGPQGAHAPEVVMHTVWCTTHQISGLNYGNSGCPYRKDCYLVLANVVI